METHEKSIFNIAGVLNDDFIEEVTESQQMKKNQLFFALLVDGLPGDPNFGVGISNLVGEHNTEKLKRQLEDRVENTMPDLVEGIKYKGTAVEQIKDQQFIGFDLHFTDLDTNEDDFIPLGFSTKN